METGSKQNEHTRLNKDGLETLIRRESSDRHPLSTLTGPPQNSQKSVVNEGALPSPSPHPMSTSNPQNQRIWYFARQRGLCRCDQIKHLQMGEIILDKPGGSNPITRVFLNERRRPESQKQKIRDGSDAVAGRGPQTKACRRPLEGGNARRHSPFEPLEGTQLCTTCVSPVRPLLDF